LFPPVVFVVLVRPPRLFLPLVLDVLLPGAIAGSVTSLRPAGLADFVLTLELLTLVAVGWALAATFLAFPVFFCAAFAVFLATAPVFLFRTRPSLLLC
jgi:hypothetical protein